MPSTENPQTYLPHDELGLALARIEVDYGVHPSIMGKDKTLTKFGGRSDLGTSNATLPTLAGELHETYSTTNDITHVVSSSAADATETITLEGHTIAAGAFTFVVQSVTLNGQTPVALTTPLARASRAYNTAATTLAGTVSVMVGSAVAGGVPSTAANARLQIPAGTQQTYKAATTLSATDYLICTSVGIGVTKKTNAAVVADLEVRLAGGVFRPVLPMTAESPGAYNTMQLHPPLVMPANADIRMTATASTNGVEVRGFFAGYLATTL